MTSFRSSRSPHLKDDGSAWNRFGLRRIGKRSTPNDSCVTGRLGSSLVSDIPSRQLRVGGLRHLASDSHLDDRYSNPHSNPSSASSHGPSSLVTESRSPRAHSMAGMLDMDRSRNRPARTFIGNHCAVCEEPLEHTLRGERVLQFSCTHVSHEACFYEYIKEIEAQYCPECSAPLGLDSSRGGNVLDLEKLSNIVRSVSSGDNGPDNSAREKPGRQDRDRESERTQDAASTPQIDHFGNRVRSGSLQGSRTSSISRTDSRNDGRHDFGDRDGHGRYDNIQWRNHSVTSGDPYMDQAPALAPSRRYEYEPSVSHESVSRAFISSIPSPIPPPIITVRSEFPALTRSKAQQSLTCIITVEVAERKHNHSEGVNAVRSSEQDPASPHDAASQYSFDRQAHERPAVAAPRVNEREFDRENEEVLASITEDLRIRVENWHGLDFSRFGKLRLHGTIKVGKDCQTWQELECYLFSEMLICVKEKKILSTNGQWGDMSGRKREKAVKCTLKGSILIKKHLQKVSDSSGADTHILTLNLSVAELPQFHLLFPNRMQLLQWHRALMDLHTYAATKNVYDDKRSPSSDDGHDDFAGPVQMSRRVPSVASGFSAAGGGRPQGHNSLDALGVSDTGSADSTHIPMDLVVVIPVSSSMQGLKIKVLRSALKFLVQNLGSHDRLGLVTFGSSGGGVPITGLMSKRWEGWPKVISSTRPVGQKSLRADVVEGANVAMDLLMQRKSSNPLASILLISDSSTSESDAVDFVISRAEAAKITIHSFGLGLTHKPDTMIEISTRTKGLFTYVKDWTMLRECVAGCVGSLQTMSHQNAKLKLKLPEGSPARFFKISGALQVSKRASGREAEASLGDLRFGDKKDILVQLVVSPDSSQSESAPQDAWESIVSGLEALGGSADAEEQRIISIEEVPLIQADLTYGNIQRDGTLSQSRQHLLTITMLPASSPKNNTGPLSSPPIPPHPLVVQRRMELLTSDMLGRSLTLVSRNQHERAEALLKETRTILRGLGKGALPPLPSSAAYHPEAVESSESREVPPPLERNFTPAAGIDAEIVSALDSELESALEWISHPAIFSRDSRKSILQAIGIISSQGAFTFRTPFESLYAERIEGVKRLSSLAREWQDADESLQEED